MLTDLVIRNLAIIEHLHVTFAPGLNVLTGETGAGKSIVIDAVSLLMGARARIDLVRSGAEEASVEALIDLSALPQVRELLATAGISAGDELIIRRVVARSGRSRLFLNGALATLGQFEQIAASLMSIYGQHEHQSLQRPESHLDLLDRYAGCAEQADRYRAEFRRVRELHERLRRLEQAEHERARRLDLLRFQRDELAAAGLSVEEEETLERERLLLLNAERLHAASATGVELLYQADGAVCEQLDRVVSQLRALAAVDPVLGGLAESLDGARITVEESARELRDYARNIDFEPGRQEQVERRLALIAGLKRKYAPSVAALLQQLVQVEQELAELENVETSRVDLARQLSQAEAALSAAGETLSRARQAGAERMKVAVERELADLAMGRVHFLVRFTPLPAPGANGLESGEFHISPNTGEEPRPLARIASGGELSRIMLALKCTAPEAEDVPVLIFDEVDAGIGGEAASAVGRKLREVARGRQVLCITHLPQVAACAHEHYRVEKRLNEGRTTTVLTHLAGDERVREMARMLGGAHVTERTLAHAREVIEHAAD